MLDKDREPSPIQPGIGSHPERSDSGKTDVCEAEDPDGLNPDREVDEYP